MENVKNYFVNFASGDTALIYVSVEGIGAHTLRRFVENTTTMKVLEVYHVPQEDLQYYCIGERVWIDTTEKAEKVKMLARNKK